MVQFWGGGGGGLQERPFIGNWVPFRNYSKSFLVVYEKLLEEFKEEVFDSSGIFSSRRLLGDDFGREAFISDLV